MVSQNPTQLYKTLGDNNGNKYILVDKNGAAILNEDELDVKKMVLGC